MRSLLVIAMLVVAGCSSEPRLSSTPSAPAPEAERPNAGGYYKDDGPGDRVPPDIASIPDAQPKLEPLSRFANRPYEALGNRYVPLTSLQPFRERGLASWYGRRYHGRKTTSGEVYDMYAMTAAHPTLPIPSYARVTSAANGRSVVVRINDRGPFLRGRVIDLSYAAAYRLGLLGTGSGEVLVEAVIPGKPETEETTAPARGIFLQVGAFSSRENAEKLRARIAAPAEAGDVVQLDNLWRVQLGPYGSEEEARGAAQRLEPTLGLKPLVVVR